MQILGGTNEFKNIVFKYTKTGLPIHYALKI